MKTTIPEGGFIRLPQVLQLIPVSRSGWYRGIKEGRYPAPIKLGERTSVWRADDIRRLINDISKAD